MKKMMIEDLENVARGAAFLGSGGGGNPYLDLIIAKQQFNTYGPSTLIGFDELQDDDLVVPVAYMGAPLVMTEKIPSGKEFRAIIQAIEQRFGKRRIVLAPGEIGGANALSPFVIGAMLNLPVLDADMLGRAFPRLEISKCNIQNVPIAPIFLADGKGNSVVLNIDKPKMVETVARHVAMAFGSTAAVAFHLMDGKTARHGLIHNTVSYAMQLGALIATSAQPLDALCSATNGKLLISGTISDIEQKVKDGFLTGTVTIKNGNNTVTLWYQNENLIATQPDNTIIATTPDIIAVLDTASGQALTTDAYKFGLRVSVLVCPPDACWTTPRGLELAGPRAFGYDVDYKPVKE